MLFCVWVFWFFSLRCKSAGFQLSFCPSKGVSQTLAAAHLGWVPDFLPNWSVGVWATFCWLSLVASQLLAESSAAGRCGRSHWQNIQHCETLFPAKSASRTRTGREYPSYCVVVACTAAHLGSEGWGFLSSFVRSLLKLWKQGWNVSLLADAQAALRVAVPRQKGGFFSRRYAENWAEWVEQTWQTLLCFHGFFVLNYQTDFPTESTMSSLVPVCPS